MLNRDHFAADVACVWATARVIECEIRAGRNHQASSKLDDLTQLSMEIEKLVRKWEGKLHITRERTNGLPHDFRT